MMNARRATVTMLIVLFGTVAGPERAEAVANPRGMLFRAVGIYQGEVEEGKCIVPTSDSAIMDGSWMICRDGTQVSTSEGTVLYPTRMFPDVTNPFANSCGGFLALQNNMINQAITVYKVKVRYKINGNGFPLPCRGQRKFNLFTGGRISPVNSINPSPFGAVNTNIMQLLPIFSTDLFSCLRSVSQTAPFVLRAKLRAFGILDDGRRIKSNRLFYSLTVAAAGNGCS